MAMLYQGTEAGPCSEEKGKEKRPEESARLQRMEVDSKCDLSLVARGSTGLHHFKPTNTAQRYPHWCYLQRHKQRHRGSSDLPVPLLVDLEFYPGSVRLASSLPVVFLDCGCRLGSHTAG